MYNCNLNFFVAYFILLFITSCTNIKPAICIKNTPYKFFAVWIENQSWSIVLITMVNVN